MVKSERVGSDDEVMEEKKREEACSDAEGKGLNLLSRKCWRHPERLHRQGQ
jgi:hypothetical protein